MELSIGVAVGQTCSSRAKHGHSENFPGNVIPDGLDGRVESSFIFVCLDIVDLSILF